MPVPSGLGVIVNPSPGLPKTGAYTEKVNVEDLHTLVQSVQGPNKRAVPFTFFIFYLSKNQVFLLWVWSLDTLLCNFVHRIFSIFFFSIMSGSQFCL